MANKFNVILVKKNNELLMKEQHRQFKNQVKSIIEKDDSKPKSGLIKSLINIINLIRKLIFLFTRLILIIIILGILAIILIGLIYPESQQQFREIAIPAWNKLIMLFTN